MFGMLQRKELYMQNSTICPKCKGNGYVTVTYQGEKTLHHEDCKYCNNQGEIKLDSDKALKQYMDYTRMVQ